MQPTIYMGPEDVCVTIYPRGFARGRLPDRHQNFSAKIGCCDEVWGGGCPKTVFLLPMGMEKKGRCMGASVYASNGSMPP